jgi:hypothetical protein
MLWVVGTLHPDSFLSVYKGHSTAFKFQNANAVLLSFLRIKLTTLEGPHCIKPSCFGFWDSIVIAVLHDSIMLLQDFVLLGSDPTRDLKALVVDPKKLSVKGRISLESVTYKI